MKTNSQRVIDWRKRTKERIVQSFGGKCGVCGYNKCQEALDLHHTNQEEKEFSLASIRAWPKAWPHIVEELRKCVLLCCRCHREFHSGLIEIPNEIQRFDERFADYKELERLDKESKNRKSCPVCGEDMFNKSKTCSLECGSKLRLQYNWESFDLRELYLEKKMSMESISRLVGCSGASVKKRLKKENLIPG